MTTIDKPVVLVVDDNKDIVLTSRILFEHAGHRVVSSRNYEKAVRLIHENEEFLMVAFVDIDLPGAHDGYDLLRYITKVAPHRIAPYAITGSKTEHVYFRATECGALHVFIKPAEPVELLNVASQKMVELKIRRNLSTNGLTGLPSLFAFTPIVESEMSPRRKQAARAFSLLQVDIDGFKKQNDTYGHLVGDAALVAVGKALSKFCRSGDHLCHSGGDEFLIFLNGADEVVALKRAEELEKVISLTLIPIDDELETLVPLSATVGAGTIYSEETGGIEELRRRADLGPNGLYTRRKQQGKESSR